VSVSFTNPEKNDKILLSAPGSIRMYPTPCFKFNAEKEVKHVMISYQWDCKPDVIELQNKLQKEGFKVWRDEDNMGM